MGLNLKKLGQSIFHGLAPNIIDHGQGWTAQRPQQPIQRGIPINPNPIRIAPVQQQRLVNAPVPQRSFNMGVAAPQPLHFGNQIIAPTIGTRAGVAPPTVDNSLLHKVTHNPVTNFAAAPTHLVGGLASSAYHIASIPVETARTATAEITGNQAAQRAAMQRAGKGFSAVAGLAQAGPRFVYGLGESLNPAGGDVYQREHTPTGLQKVVFGKDPIPSWQKTYQTTKAQQGSAQAKGEAVLNAVMAAAPLAKGVPKVSKATVKMAENRTPLTEVGAVGKNVNRPEIKQSNSGNIYIKHPNGQAVTGLPKTIQNDLYNHSQGIPIQPDRAVKLDNYLSKNGLGFDYNRGLITKSTNSPALPGKFPANLRPSVKLKNTENSAGQGSGVQKANTVPSEAEFNKMIPAVKGTPAESAPALERFQNMTPEERANLPPAEQMALDRAMGGGPPSKAEVAAGMKANPYQSNVHEVAPENWVAARTAGDAVSNPIMHSAKFTDYHLGKLAKEDPALYNGFWDAIEKGVIPDNAPPSFREAAKWFRETANGVHKEANTLGTPTRYQKNWELRAASLKDVTPDEIGSGELGSVAKHAVQRKYGTHAEFVAAAEKAGLAVEHDPRKALQKYATATTSSLQRKALAQSLAEADRNNLSKPHTVDLGWGTTVKLSDEGLHQAKGILKMNPRKTKLGTVYDATNSFRKGLLLSVSQFHTVNVAGLRAAPSLLMPKPGYLAHGDLTMGVHPVRAARGLYGTGRALLPGGKGFAVKSLEKAYERGDVQFAARHGTPIGQSSYGASKHFNIGHNKVFVDQLPRMQTEVIGALRRDLNKFGIPEGSPAAMEAGKVANFTMGFINRAAMNMSPTTVKGIERVMLAGQFTPSKLANLYKGSTELGLAGSMARADVAANAISAAAMIVGIGYLVRQKSDDVRDMVLRALINPAVPTNIQDKKGNTQEVRIPMTYTAEVAHLLGIKLVRQNDGHLGVDFNPKNWPEGASEWARARLSPNLGDVVKIATNKEFGNKPLYEEGAPFGKQAIQVATKTIQGGLPIGLQGVGYTEAVKKRLPGSAREVLEAGTPSNNPLVKSLTSSVGFTVRTDKTVGKALDTGRYFSAKDEVKSMLKNDQAKAAFELNTGSKKNSVTGKYNVKPTVWDTITKADALLQNPDAFNAMVEMNNKIAAQGGKVDPLWRQPKENIIKYLQYQANLDPFSPQRSVWYDNNKDWYEPLSKERGKFFGSLPPGDPNKPQAPVEYPTPSKQIQSLKDQYYKIDDGQKAYQFTKAHPDLQDQFDKEFKYKNDLLKARGQTPYKAYPKATPQLQSYMDKYNAADKATRKAIRNSNPGAYQKMIAYYDSVGLHNINSEGSKNQLVGQPDQTSKQNKAISSLAKDIYQNADGTYQIVPAGWMQGLNNGSGGYGYGGRKSYGYKYGNGQNPEGKDNPTANPYKYAVGLNAGGTPRKPRVRSASSSNKTSAKVATAKPKVTLKRSKV